MSWTPVNTALSPAWPAVATDVFYTYFLLQEDGAFLLQEDGFKIVAAYVQPAWPDVVTAETNPWTPV